MESKFKFEHELWKSLREIIKYAQDRIDGFRRAPRYYEVSQEQTEILEKEIEALEKVIRETQEMEEDLCFVPYVSDKPYIQESKMLKSEYEVWKEYEENDRALSQETLSDLKWYIENEDDPWWFMDVATCMIASSHAPQEDMKKILIPALAEQLNHKKPRIRNFALECIVSDLKTTQYSEKIFSMALSDPDVGVRTSAISRFGDLIDESNQDITCKMVSYLHEILTTNDFEKYDTEYRDNATRAILKLEKNATQWSSDRAWHDPDFDPIWKNFIKNYKLQDKPVVREFSQIKE